MKKFITRFTIVLLLCLGFTLVFSGCNRGKTESVEFPQGVWMWGSALADEDVQTVVNKFVENNISPGLLFSQGHRRQKNFRRKINRVYHQSA